MKAAMRITALVLGSVAVALGVLGLLVTDPWHQAAAFTTGVLIGALAALFGGMVWLEDLDTTRPAPAPPHPNPAHPTHAARRRVIQTSAGAGQPHGPAPAGPPAPPGVRP